MIAEEQIYFYFCNIYSDFTQTFRYAYLHICLYNFELVKGFGQNMLTAGNGKLFSEIPHFNEVNTMLYLDHSHKVEDLSSTAQFWVLHHVAIFILQL